MAHFLLYEIAFVLSTNFYSFFRLSFPAIFLRGSFIKILSLCIHDNNHGKLPDCQFADCFRSQILIRYHFTCRNRFGQKRSRTADSSKVNCAVTDNCLFYLRASFALTHHTGKSQIQAEIKAKMQETLTEQDIGIQVVNITVQDAEPPTSEIVSAFKAVETAKQGKDTAINNANKYQNEQIPAAEAAADKIIQSATAQKTARIAEAEGQVARFSAMYEEYTKNPQITRQRLYYEAIEDVLPGIKVIIDNGETQKVLPLSSFTESDGESSSSDKNASGEVDQNGGK